MEKIQKVHSVTVNQSIPLNAENFSLLVKGYVGQMKGLAIKFVRNQEAADEIVQDSLVKAFRYLSSLRENASLKSWLMQITANTAKNYLRREKRFFALPYEDFHFQESCTQIRDFEFKSSFLKIVKLIDELPDKQKEIFRLKVFHEYSLKEISQELDSPYDTVKANYRHAYLRLRERMLDTECE